MTIQELESYRVLLNEIKALNRWKELLATPYNSPKFNNPMTSNSSTKSITEVAVERMMDVEEKINALLEELNKKKDAIYSWILQIHNSEVRAICIYRYLQGMNWKDVSEQLHYEESYPRKIIVRYLENEQG